MAVGLPDPAEVPCQDHPHPHRLRQMTAPPLPLTGGWTVAQALPAGSGETPNWPDVPDASCEVCPHPPLEDSRLPGQD